VPFHCSVKRVKQWICAARARELLVVLQLLRQIVLITHFTDGVQLRFQPVDVVFLVGEDLLRQLARPAIVHRDTHLDAVV